MYRVYDSTGTPVGGKPFPSYMEALEFKQIYGNLGWYIERT